MGKRGNSITAYEKLEVAKVRAHSLQKHKNVCSYAGTFFRALKNQGKPLIYLDLFCGPGLAILKNAGKHAERFPTPASRIPNFADSPHRCIFCDKNEKYINSLSRLLQKHRQLREDDMRDNAKLKPFPETHFVLGDVNCPDNLRKIESLIPRGAFCFCYLDPYNLGNLKFQTIRRLADGRKMDFLVLIASGMDGRRNMSYYIKEDNQKLNGFLGNTDWRERWQKIALIPQKGNAEQFVSDEFDRSMRSVPSLQGKNYRRLRESDIVPIYDARSGRRLLYRLVLYSRHALAYKLWSGAQKSSAAQKSLI
jgi:three-Cys-motif partner protein